MQAASGQLAKPIYLLAAAVARVNECPDVRDNVRTLLVGKATRIHWRDEQPERQRKIAALIAQQELLHTVVVGTPLDPKKQERGRRQCMERLLHELVAMGVSRVWLENRTPSLNKKDIEMVAALRSKKMLPASVFVNLALPSEEPMLWIPDAIAGAVGAHRKAIDSTAHAVLASMIHEIELSLR